MLRIASTSVNIYVALVIRLVILLIIYILCRIGFYGLNASLFHDMHFYKCLRILIAGVKFDMSALLYLNSLYILLQTLPFTFRYRDTYQFFCKWLFIITNSIAISFNFIDFVYYPFTLKRMTASVFAQFSNEENNASLGFNFLIDYWSLLLLFILTIWVLIKLYDLLEIKTVKAKNIYIYSGLHFIAMLAIATIAIIGMRGGRLDGMPITPNYAAEFVDFPNEVCLVLNTPFSIMKTLTVEPIQERHYFSEAQLSQMYNPIHMPHPTKEFKALNVVVLIIESFGKEHIGSLNKDLYNGRYKGYTPFLDSLIENSLTFTHAYANGRNSIDALPAIISSIPSIQEHFVLSLYFTNSVSSLAESLKKKGYHTSFFHGASNSSMGFSSYTKLAGIDHYYGRTEYNNDTDYDGSWGIWDEPFLQYTAKELNQFKEPFFSTLFTVSSHSPFNVPKEYEGKFPKGPLEVQKCIGYTDMALGKFFATASKMPWFKNTLFVLTADHATVSHFPEYQNAPGAYAIPILMYYPAGNLNGKVDQLAQQIDIMPTVLSFLQYDQHYFSFGNNILDKELDHFIINYSDGNYHLYFKDYFLLNNGEKNKALYNLEEDPLLKNNLLGADIALENIMEDKLKAFIQQYNNRMIHNQIRIN